MAKAATPSVVAASASTYATGLGNQGKTVVDTFGNVFSIDIAGGDVWEIPVGGGTPKKVASPGCGSSGLAIDSANNLYVTQTYCANVFQIPYSNGSYSGTQINLMGNFGSLDGYYMFVNDVAVDNAGHAFISQGGCCQPGSPIFEVNVDGTNPTLLTTLPGGPAQSLAVDKNNHLYYADGSKVYVINTAASTPTPVAIGSFKAPGGVAVDAAGNLYVADGGTSSVYVIPNENGALNAADQFFIESGLTGYSNFAPGVDGAGNLYLGDGYSSTVLHKVVPGGASFGSAAAGTAASATLNFFFNAAATPAAISVLQGTGAATEFATASGGSCAAGTAYTAGQSCTVNVTMTAATTGARSGAVVLYDSANKALATGYLSGFGTGVALTVDPGTQTALTAKSAWNTPSAVAMDSAGNYYAADSGANTVQVISSTGTATASIGSGLSKPGGVAVDSAGNVYIADTGNNRVVKVPNENGTLKSADQSVVASSLSSPLGLALDASGALYIADSGNKRVLRVPSYGGAALATGSTVGSGYTNPVAVAADGRGSLYVADKTAGQVVVVNLAGGAQSVAANQLNTPTAIGLDASGSLYVVQAGNGTVVRIPNVGGVLNATGNLLLGAGLSSPSGVAVNGAGNVVIADAGKPAVYSLQRTSGALPMGAVNIALTGTPQTVTLTSAGTAAATLGAPPYIATGSTANFSVTSPSSGGCAASQTLAIGTSCTLSAVFAPVVLTTPLADVLTFSSNAVNASVISETLSGTVTNLSTTTTTLALVSPTGGNPFYGQAVTIGATVAANKVGFTPTGVVTFFVDGIGQPPVALSTASPYVASLTLTGLTAGGHSINVVYGGDANNASSSSATPLTVTVTQATSSVAVTVFPLGTVSQVAGSLVTFTANVTAASGTPTGTVSLVLAGTTTALASGTVSAGKVVLTYVPPATGSYQVIYSGDVNFKSSTSSAVAVSIGPQDFAVSASSSTLTTAAGQSVSTTITVTSISGYQGTITVGALNIVTGAVTDPCSALPAYVTCSFIFPQGALTLQRGTYPAANSSASFTLTVSTNVPPVKPYPSPTGSLIWPLGLAALALTAKKRGSLARSRLTVLLWCVSLGGVVMGVSGCGNSSAFVTPAGTTPITLTVSGPPVGQTAPPTLPNITHTVALSLTVQ